MPAFTTNQWAILFLVLLLGWILGLASRSGGGKWKRAYETERDEHGLAERRHAEEIAAARARLAELERVTAATPGGAARSARRSRRGGACSRRRSVADPRHRPVGRERLAEHGIHSYRDIRSLDATGKAEVERRVGAPPARSTTIAGRSRPPCSRTAIPTSIAGCSRDATLPPARAP